MSLKFKLTSVIFLALLSNILLILFYQGRVFNAGMLGCAGGYNESTNMIYAGDGGIVSFGPYCKVNKGPVKIELYYTAKEEGNYFDIFSLSKGMEFKQVFLSPDKVKKTIFITFNETVSDLEIRTFYGGNKQFGVSKIVVTEFSDYVKWIAVLNLSWLLFSIIFFSKKNKKRILMACELGIMMLMLLSHLYLHFYFQDDKYAINENRNKKELPQSEWWTALVDDGSYCAELENYFNDNFKTRDFFIRVKNQIKYTVFHESDGVYIDKEGYLYYRDVIDKSEIINEKMTDGEVERSINSLAELKNYLQMCGKDFYFMIPPQKNTAFPQRIVTNTVVRPSPNAYERFLDKIDSSVVKQNFVDVLEVLREGEEYYPTYNKTDYHWNYYGATIAYMQLVNAISQSKNLGKIYTEKNFEVYFLHKFRGGQLMELNILQDISEEQVRVKKVGEITMTDIQYDRYFYHYSARNSVDAPLGNLLIIGDSYSEWALQSESGLFDCFQEVKYVRKNVVENDIDEYINWADYVVFESIEIDICNMESIIGNVLDR